MKPEDKLQALGISLPPASPPLGSYVPWVRTGDLIYLSGILPLVEGKILSPGRLGESVTTAEGVAAARRAAVNALAVLKAAVGSLENVSRIVRLTGHVASSPAFSEQPEILNGASDLLVDVFGERGRHTRVAVGAASLPRGACVEIDLIIEVRGN